MPSITPRTADLLLILALLGVVAAGYRYSDLLLPKADVALRPLPGCDLQKTACRAELPEGGSLEFSITPRPIPLAAPVRVQVSVAGMEARTVEVDFAGVTMNMGYNRPQLAAAGDGRFAAEATLPVCVTGEMEWTATVLVESGRRRLMAPFRFTAGGAVEGSAANPLATAAPPATPPALAAAPAGGDFTLASAQGAVSLASLRGQVALLFFGYTYCPDICPTSLAAVAQALSGLAPVEQRRVRALFVSVDPARDSPQRLADYVAYFHPAIVGLTGSTAEVAAVAARYGAVFRAQPPDREGRYAVDHSAFVYVIGPDGRIAATLGYPVSVPGLQAEIRKSLTIPTIPSQGDRR